MRRRRILAIILILSVAACSVPGQNPTEASSATPECYLLQGQRIDGMAWSGQGERLAMVALDESSAEGVISILDRASGTIQELVRLSDMVTLAGVSFGPSGVAWVQTEALGPALWSSTDDGARLLGRLERPVFNLRETRRGFMALDSAAERPAVVRLELPVEPMGSVRMTPEFQPLGRVESFDIAADEGRLVYANHDDTGEPWTFVIRQSGKADDIYQPASRLVANPTLAGDFDRIYYEDHDVGALIEVEVSTGTARQVISDDVSEAAVSLSGAIAYTFVDPRRTDLVCIKQVGSP